MTFVRAIALVVAAIALCVTGSSGSARADEACSPAAVVTGDPELAGEVTADLERRGVAATTRAGCPRVTAKLTRDGELVHVEVTDDYGRSRTWEVRDVGTASALVESWTKQEIDESELPPETPKAAPPPVVAMVPSETVSETIVPVATPVARARGGASFTIESASAGDAPWFGGAIGGCVRLAAVCAGGRLRGARSTPTHHEMTAIDLLATVELPIALGGFVVSPGAVLGVGWTRVTDDDPHALDPSMDMGGLRAGAQLAVARPIAAAFSVELAISFDGVLLGQGDAPAALPRGLARIGLGLRYGRR